MNPFFDISKEKDLPAESHQLRDLGNQRIYASFGKRTRGEWGERGTYQSSNVYTDVTTADYDNQFISKLVRVRPVYEMDKLINHHFNYYISQNPQQKKEFLKHMRYEIFPALRKRTSNEAYIQLFEEWLDNQSPKPNKDTMPNTVNNTINVGNVNAPTQFQQNSDHSVQTQQNHYQKEQIKEAFELLSRDIQNVNEQIRNDFAIEMDYAIAQLEKDKDIKPQLLSIGSLMKDVGINTFANLLAAPVYEFIKPFLGLN